MQTLSRAALLAGTSLAALAAAGCVRPAGSAGPEPETVMISPKVVSIHTVDASSPEAIVRSIIKPGMSQEEKALAVWRYCWENVYHWPAPQEDLRSRHELDVVYDANKLIDVYGYTYCFAARAPAEALLQAAGIEARSGGIGGHCIWEVYFDGKWHFIDSDQRGFSRLADGSIASLEDYRGGRARELVLQPGAPSVPFFPAVKRPMMIYEQKQIFTGYMMNHAVHYHQHDKFRTTHPMQMSLRPGERFTRSWKNAGKWNCPPGLAGECKAIGYVDPWPGPFEHEADLYPESVRNDDGSPQSFGNGLMVYRPNLAAGARDYSAGVFADENVDATGAGFGPAAAGKPARADFRVWLPYVIAGWPDDIEKREIAGAAVVSGRCLRRTGADSVKVLVSTDEGASWQEVWTAGKTGESDFAVDVSKHVEGRYGYRVRFELAAAAAPTSSAKASEVSEAQGRRSPGDARILSFGLDTACQLNARTLPAVRAGENRMTVSFEPGTEVFEETVNYDPKLDPAARAFEVGNLVVKGRSYAELGAPEKGQTGHVVYELPVPPGRRIAWAKVGGSFRSDSGVPADETYRIWYAIDRPSGWKLLWEGDPAPYLAHWCFEGNAEVPLARGAERVFVKYELGRSARKGAEGGKMVQARFSWGCDPAGKAAAEPAPGVRITHAWRQDGRERSFSQAVAGGGGSYSFDAPGGKVENLSIAMELDGRGPCSEAPHPLMAAAPKLERHALDDNEGVKAMREALARLDKDPSVETAADIMWHCQNKMTAGVMPQALMAIGGEKAREELKKAVGKINGAQGCLMELLSFEGPVEDLAAFLKDGDEGTRAEAARLLARKGDKTAVEALRAALVSEDDKSALAAEAAALVRLGDSETAAGAAGLLERSRPAGQIELAAALAASGNPLGFPVLEQALSSPEKKLRHEAALALGASARPNAEKGLLTALADKSRWVRLAATAGLARCGGQTSIKPLKAAAEGDADYAVKAEARWALGEVEKRLATTTNK